MPGLAASSERPVMIDWVTARLPLACPGPLCGGYLVRLDADGDEERRSVMWMPQEGSYSSSVSLRGGFGEVWLSGNPSKYLQGHNLFGSSDLRALVAATMEDVAARLDITPSADDRASWAAGDYDVSRVDVTRMLPIGSANRVGKLLDVLGQVARTKYQGGLYDRGTVYLGKHSRRLSLKFYDKSVEMRKPGHMLCAKLAPIWHQPLADWAVGKLRAELVLRSNELRDRRLHRASAWLPGVAESLLDERLSVLEVNDTMRLEDDIVLDLPPTLMRTYDSWQAGRNLREMMAKNTFYRHRKQLLRFGVDIAHVQPRMLVPKTEYLGGFSVRELLNAPGAPPPVWAHNTELLAS